MPRPNSGDGASQTSRTSKAKKLGGSTSWLLNIKLLNGKDLAARDTTASGDYGSFLMLLLTNVAMCGQIIDSVLEELGCNQTAAKGENSNGDARR